jgi:lipoyl(octanoyl) transferase
VEYPVALGFMEERVAQIRAGIQPEMVWLLEHPPLYTAGTSAKASDLMGYNNFPIYDAGRGGQYTYHGPGQRVAYVMLDLKKRLGGAPDIRRFVWLLEEWLIRTVAEFGIKGERREGRIGIWVATLQGEAKIAALGIRVRQWVSFHGVSLNVNPDLSHYAGIVPCGIKEHGVTSLAALGVKTRMADVDSALRRQFDALEWNA